MPNITIVKLMFVIYNEFKNIYPIIQYCNKTHNFLRFLSICESGKQLMQLYKRLANHLISKDLIIELNTKSS